MREQEQIKHAKSTVSDWLAEETHWESPYFTLEDVKVIGKVLEKQIPKKMDMYSEGHTGDLIYKCPTCGEWYNRFYYGKPYCLTCGQKLLWEENE